MKLSALISNSMILQRNKQNLIWGNSLPNQKITLTLKEESTQALVISKECTADSNGYFQIALPEQKAGGPFLLTITGDETVSIKDILFGDIYILGGQSNMEYYMGMLMDRAGYKIFDDNLPQIRSFEVAKVYNFTGNTEDLDSGKWCKANKDEIRSFSAIAFYAAKILHAEHNIPIGFIHTAVGGTPVKSWTNAETIKARGLYTDQYNQALVPGFIAETEKRQNEEERIWMEDADKAFDIPESIATGLVEVPGIWNKEPLHNVHGSIILKTQFTLTKEIAQQDLDIHLGTIFDQDKTYINGVMVGTTGYRYPTRHYHIPKGTLKEGVNELLLKVMVFRNTGSITPGKDICLCKEGTLESVFDLSGQWQFEIKKQKDTLYDKTFFIYYPSGLYQGMLYPIRKVKASGFMFYQGESNVECYSTYCDEMKDMISDWRKLFNDDTMPFFEVQLAGYSNEDYNLNGTGWADLREQQNLLRSYDNVYMIEAYDLGEYNDLHPINKAEVGKRMAMAIDKVVYDTGNGCVIPELDSISKEDDSFVLTFKNYGSSLVIKTSNITYTYTGSAGDFEAVCKDGSVIKVDAVLKNNKVFITYNPDYTHIRFAYKDCKVNANIYGDNGIPLLPFNKQI